MKRKFLSISFSAIFALLLALNISSCGKKQDDVFDVSIVADFQSISPGSDISALSKSVLNNMNSTLYAYNPSSKEYEPSMAKDVSLNDNILTIELRDDLFFHNDEKVTAKDVAYSFNRNAGYVADFLMYDTALSELIGENSIKIIDDLNLEITLNKEVLNSNALYDIYNTIIVPESVKESDQLTHPISAGPYKFVSYSEGNEITFTKFDKYFNEKPEIDDVRFKIISDESSALMAYKNNEIDYLWLTPKDADSFKGTSLESTVYSALSNDTNTLFLNQTIEPFDNIEIRKAIKYGINKQDVISLSTNSFGVMQNSILSPYQEAYYNNNLVTNEYNPELARRIMAEYGYSDTNRLSIPLKVVAENATNVSQANVLKSNLSEIFIDVTIQEVPWSTYLPDVYYDKKFEATILQLAGYDSPYNTMRFFKSDYVGNLSGYNNQTYDNYLDEILNTYNEEDKAQLFKEAQTILFYDVAGIFLGDEGRIIGLNSKYEGVTFYPYWFTDVSKIKVKK